MIRRLIIFGLVVVGLMTLGGYLGWSQGYIAGLAAEGERIHGFGGAAVPLFLGLGLLNIFFFVFSSCSSASSFSGDGNPTAEHTRGTGAVVWMNGIRATTTSR